jgi:hypothetical protein
MSRERRDSAKPKEQQPDRKQRVQHAEMWVSQIQVSFEFVLFCLFGLGREVVGVGWVVFGGRARLDHLMGFWMEFGRGKGHKARSPLVSVVQQTRPRKCCSQPFRCVALVVRRSRFGQTRLLRSRMSSHSDETHRTEPIDMP